MHKAAFFQELPGVLWHRQGGKEKECEQRVADARRSGLVWIFPEGNGMKLKDF